MTGQRDPGARNLHEPARIQVTRDRNEPAPREPKTVPDAPLPNAAPAVAPGPLCTKTKATIAIAISTWKMFNTCIF